MKPNWLTHPLAALLLYIAISWLVYRLAGHWAARGPDTPGKRQPYACGEEFTPQNMRLSYARFFRLALCFAVAHIAVVIVATTLGQAATRLTAIAYLITVLISVDALMGTSHA